MAAKGVAPSTKDQGDNQKMRPWEDRRKAKKAKKQKVKKKYGCQMIIEDGEDDRGGRGKTTVVGTRKLAREVKLRIRDG
jgi:hypothetical protein